MARIVERVAIERVAVEQGDDSGAPLRIATRAIAEKFIEYYWRQAVPYATSAAALVLRQNTDRQAAVIRHIEAARQQFDGSLPAIMRYPLSWHGLVGAVDQVIRVMPLWKLQRVEDAGTAAVHDEKRTGDHTPGVPQLLFDSVQPAR